MTAKVSFDIICPNLRTRNMLEFAINKNGKGRFFPSKGKPDLVIVDCETSDTLTEFARFRARNPLCPAVLLFNQHKDIDDAADLPADAVSHLVRPFSVKDLMQAIDRLLKDHSSADNVTPSRAGDVHAADAVFKPLRAVIPGQLAEPVSPEPVAPARNYSEDVRTIDLSTPAGKAADNGSCPALVAALPIEKYLDMDEAGKGDVDLGNSAALQGIQLNPEKRLVRYFADMIASTPPDPQAICLNLDGAIHIHFNPVTKMVARSGDFAGLPDISQREFDPDQVSVTREPFPATLTDTSCELEAFLWKLALYTYRGRLPQGTDVQEPVYLRYWPNLTRLEPVPNGMRIASLWSRQPASLASLIGRLRIPQRQVFAFYAAANSIGLAGPATRQADGMLTASLPMMGVRSHTIIQQLADKLIRKDRSPQ
jgi:CheY-like chemotaxis protein